MRSNSVSIFRKISLFTAFSFAVIIGLMTAIAFAVDDPATVVVPDSDFILAAIAAIGGFKGLTGGALVAGIVQLVTKALQTSFAQSKVPGKWRFVLVYTLTVAGTVMVDMFVNKMTFLSSLFSSQVFAMIQVFGFNIYKQFMTPKGDVPVTPPAT